MADAGDVEKRGDDSGEGVAASEGTAHRISHDPWYHPAFVLTTGVNSAFVLGYSSSVMVPLGWVGGTVGLFLAAAISLNANTLIARLHDVGGRRHIRYRDLAGHIYGRRMYSITWMLQYVNLFMFNAIFFILAGQALKAVYVLYRDDGVLKLPYSIVIAGVVCLLFALVVPHLSALGVWLSISMILSLIYIITTIVLSIQDGVNSPGRDYSIPGSRTGKIFGTIGAIGTLVFAYNSGMLPEIQATVKPPVIRSMEKALWFQFTVGGLPMYIVTFGATGHVGPQRHHISSTSSTAPSGSKRWPTLQHSFRQLSPSIYGPARFMNSLIRCTGGEKVMLFQSTTSRSWWPQEGGTLVAALLPFVGDMMSLTGAISAFPLSFILANHMYLTVKKSKISVPQRAWHWINVVRFSCLAIFAAVSAVRFIAIHSSTYNVFADL